MVVCLKDLFDKNSVIPLKKSSRIILKKVLKPGTIIRCPPKQDFLLWMSIDPVKLLFLKEKPRRDFVSPQSFPSYLFVYISTNLDKLRGVTGTVPNLMRKFE
jgi:hypothetical protein